MSCDCSSATRSSAKKRVGSMPCSHPPTDTPPPQSQRRTICISQHHTHSTLHTTSTSQHTPHAHCPHLSAYYHPVDPTVTRLLPDRSAPTAESVRRVHWCLETYHSAVWSAAVWAVMRRPLGSRCWHSLRTSCCDPWHRTRGCENRSESRALSTQRRRDKDGAAQRLMSKPAWSNGGPYADTRLPACVCLQYVYA